MPGVKRRNQEKWPGVIRRDYEQAVSRISDRLTATRPAIQPHRAVSGNRGTPRNRIPTRSSFRRRPESSDGKGLDKRDRYWIPACAGMTSRILGYSLRSARLSSPMAVTSIALEVRLSSPLSSIRRRRSGSKNGVSFRLSEEPRRKSRHILRTHGTRCPKSAASRALLPAISLFVRKSETTRSSHRKTSETCSSLTNFPSVYAKG